MNIVITSATALESGLLAERTTKITSGIHLRFHTSDVGIMASTYTLTNLLQNNFPDLIIQCGIGGSFTKEDDIGKTFLVESDCAGSLGVEENNEWKDIFDNGFAEANAFPFTQKKLINPWINDWNVTKIPLANALTVDEISTKKERIRQLKNKYGATLESMEGAPFHYVCLQKKVPFLQIRSISNKVGIRDKTQWNINQALENMTNVIIDYLNKIKT